MKDFERIPDVHQKLVHGLKNVLPFKGLSLIESYLEGRLWIAMKYNFVGGRKVENAGSVALHTEKRPLSFMAVLNNKINSSETAYLVPGTIENINPVCTHFRGGGDEQVMFISDVKDVQGVQPELPAFIRLYVIEDDVANTVAGSQSLQFVSIDGTFKRLPVFKKGELRVSGHRLPVGFDQDAIRVIEGGPEIVNDVAQNGWRVPWKDGGLSDLPALCHTVLAIGRHSLHVFSGKPLEDGYELTDVMFSPFYL